MRHGYSRKIDHKTLGAIPTLAAQRVMDPPLLALLFSWRFRRNFTNLGGMGAFMPRYSEERRAAVLKKLLPSQNRSVVSVAVEEGMSDVTLHSWLKQC